MNLHSLIEARQAEVEKLLVCPNTGCDNHGTIAVQVGEDEWEPQPCQYCYEVIMPLRAFHTETIRLILEAQCAMLEGKKNEAIKLGTRADEVGPKFHWTGRVTALTEIIASNRDLLEKLQS